MRALAEAAVPCSPDCRECPVADPAHWLPEHLESPCPDEVRPFAGQANVRDESGPTHVAPAEDNATRRCKAATGLTAADDILARHVPYGPACACGRQLPCPVPVSVRHRRDFFANLLAVLDKTYEYPQIRELVPPPLVPRRHAGRCTRPRPVVIDHVCGGGDCEMKRKDYYLPRSAGPLNAKEDADQGHWAVDERDQPRQVD